MNKSIIDFRSLNELSPKNKEYYQLEKFIKPLNSDMVIKKINDWITLVENKNIITLIEDAEERKAMIEKQKNALISYLAREFEITEDSIKNNFKVKVFIEYAFSDDAISDYKLGGGKKTMKHVQKKNIIRNKISLNKKKYNEKRKISIKKRNVV
jgi:hypothetical protein